MNNLEWLRTLDADVLAGMLIGDCTMCAYGKTGCGTESCVEGIAEWLRTEHEEDSWEKIEEDARLQAAQYWKCESIPCAECPVRIKEVRPNELYDVVSCATAQRLDIARRCKELAERERGE